MPFPTNGLESLFTTEYLTRFAGGALGALTLPYLAVIRRKLGDIDINVSGFEYSSQQASECYGILQEKLTNPCLLELIWSYWHEEGMLVQTMNAIRRRFQNLRGRSDAGSARQPGDRSAAAAQQPALGLHPGRAAPADASSAATTSTTTTTACGSTDARCQRMRPADTRSKFLEAFHNLLHLCTMFFKQDDDTTVIADGFPVLNALKEVHLILSRGRAQPVRRSAVDRAHRDADAAVAAGAAGVPRVPADAHHAWPTRSRGWTASTR